MPGARTTATQLDARTGRHDPFDRLVLVFADSVPGYRIEYVDQPPAECGSGRPVELPGAAFLSIRLDPARAHNGRGAATVQRRAFEPDMAAIQAVRLTCDFEGVVRWVVGLSERAPASVFSLSGPARLVVDFRS